MKQHSLAADALVEGSSGTLPSLGLPHPGKVKDDGLNETDRVNGSET